MQIVKPNLSAIAKAVAFLKKGGVIICPTDTVYGFLADASNKKAVDKIYKIKKRPKSKPLPIFVSNIKMAKELAEIDARQMRYLKKYWPGKYTFILPKRGGGTIALRIPKYSFLQKLLKKVNRPLAQTSVNISEQTPLNSLGKIMAIFGKNKLVGLIINAGDINKIKPSRIVDLTTYNLTVIR